MLAPARLESHSIDKKVAAVSFALVHGPLPEILACPYRSSRLLLSRRGFVISGRPARGRTGDQKSGSEIGSDSMERQLTEHGPG